MNSQYMSINAVFAHDEKDQASMEVREHISTKKKENYQSKRQAQKRVQ
jgi:hypothetical protein